MPRCCRYVSPRLPGRAAWNAASCWARSGRPGAGARGAGGSVERCLAAAAGGLARGGGGCRWLWHALPAGWRPPEGRLALLLLAPLRPRRVQVAPGPTGKAHETAAMHLHAQAALAVGAVEGAERPQHMATFADDGAAGRKVRLGKREVVTGRVSWNMLMASPLRASCPDQAGRSTQLSPYRRAGSSPRSAPPPAPVGSPYAPALPSETTPHPPHTPGHHFL